MPARSKYSALMLVLLGILVGALVFSHWNDSTQPILFSSPQTTQSGEVGADRPLATLRDLNKAFIDIAKAVNPTVVTVSTEKILKARRPFGDFFGGPFEDFFQEFFGQRPRQRREPEEQEFRQSGLGSGVIVTADGYILTNNHVIQGADTIRIRLIDKRVLPARIVGADPKTDIAVLKVDARDLQSIKLGDSEKLQVGEWVLAVGSPLSENLAHSVTSGIVSAKGRSNVGLAEYEDFIQTDAAINPGNSGGALINLDGELVGINTAIATRSGGFQGIGFAVPVNMANGVMESLIKHGTVVRGWLGVYIQDIDQTMAKALNLPGTEGVLISDVPPDGPAAKSGIKQGDVVLAMNGKKVINTNQLRNEIAATAPGTKVDLQILRDGKERTITVTLGKLDGGTASAGPTESTEKLLGFKVSTLTRDLADRYQIDRSVKGVVVTDISLASAAYRSGLREGDVIVSINRKNIGDLGEFSDSVKGLAKGDTVLLRVIRQERSFFIAFNI